jgi:Spy/CpxP family protein refolding chaperone
MNNAFAALALALAAATSGHAQTSPADSGWGPMMGGYGWGMGGPGMMGPGMMGRGMTGPWPSDLTSDQQAKIAQVQRELRAKQWPLMQQMHELMWEYNAAADEQAERKLYERHAAIQRQMFENMIDARKRTDAVFTPQQREQMRRGSPATRQE